MIWERSDQIVDNEVFRKELNSVGVKLELCCNQYLVTSNTYKFKIVVFKIGPPEDFLRFLKDDQKSMDGAATNISVDKILFIQTLPQVEYFH